MRQTSGASSRVRRDSRRRASGARGGGVARCGACGMKGGCAPKVARPVSSPDRSPQARNLRNRGTGEGDHPAAPPKACRTGGSAALVPVGNRRRGRLVCSRLRSDLGTVPPIAHRCALARRQPGRIERHVRCSRASSWLCRRVLAQRSRPTSETNERHRLPLLAGLAGTCGRLAVRDGTA